MPVQTSAEEKYSTVKRQIGVFTATSIVVANMIGAGIFTTSGIMAANLPSASWVIFCWLFGGFIALSGALSYAELATRMPHEGGEYLYLKRLYHPSLGFLTGWTSFFVGFSAPIAASAMGFSEYIFSGLNLAQPIHILFIKKLSSILIISIFTTIHYFGLKLGSKVQNVLTVLKIIIVLGLASAGLIYGTERGIQSLLNQQGEVKGIAFGTAMMLVMFAYSGWNASAYIAGEIKNPRRSLPVSLVTGTLIVLFLYLAINLFIFQSAPYDVLQGKIAIVEAASIQVFGPGMVNFLSILVGIALLSSLSAFIIIGPRVYFAMAQDRLFFPSVSIVHPRFSVPGRAILIQGLIAALMVLVGSFEQLLIYIGFALGIFPWLAILGLFFARKNKIGEDTAVKVIGYPFLPIFYLISSLLILFVAFLNRPLESSIAILTVLCGIPVYFLWIKKFHQ
jgi:APA family basic amino acid/polyamine antiporter